MVIVFRGSRPLSVGPVAFRTVVRKNITHGDESVVEVTVPQVRKHEAKIKKEGRKKERSRSKVSLSVACPSTRPGLLKLHHFSIGLQTNRSPAFGTSILVDIQGSDCKKHVNYVIFGLMSSSVK